MLDKQKILKQWQNIKKLFEKLKIAKPIWYASLKIPALELEKRLIQLFKEL